MKLTRKKKRNYGQTIYNNIFSLNYSSKCKYYAEADVVNNEIVNKKEHYTCVEKENFFIRFITEEKFQQAFVTLVMVVAENI